MSKDPSNTSPPSGGGERYHAYSASIPSAEEVEKKLTDRGATPEQLEEILWLVDFAKTQGANSFAKLAKAIAVSESQVSLILRGKYEAGLAGFCETIKNFREIWTERQQLGPVVFVPELSVVRRIDRFATLTRMTQQIGIVWGPNQSGKSKALKYVGKTRKLTAYCKLPAGGGVKDSMTNLALARGGIPIRKSTIELRARLLKAFNPQWLIIADEFHQTVKGRTLKTVTIDRFREFNDDCECGLLLCGTDQLPEIMEDEQHRHFLGQIGNRGVLRLRIPIAPEPRDIELLINAFGFHGAMNSKAARKVQEIANEQGIGKLCRFFTISRRLASTAHERLNWAHFNSSVATIDSWSVGEFGNGKSQKQIGNGGGEAKQLEEGSAE
jgi:hypothetical protein